MTKESRLKKILWLEHLIWMLSTWTLFGVALAVIALGSGLANPVLRHFLVNRLQNLTGSRVEVRTVSVGWFSLTATVKGLVIHGKEPESTEPLFSTEQAKLGLRIDSFWGRRVSLNDLVLVQPRVHLLVQKDGSNNLPALKQQGRSKQPLQQTLLDLHLRRLAGLGVRTVFLEVDEKNAPAGRLYRKVGFYDVGRRQGYYEGRATALVLRRDLT